MGGDGVLAVTRYIGRHDTNAFIAFRAKRAKSNECIVQ